MIRKRTRGKLAALEREQNAHTVLHRQPRRPCPRAPV